MKKIFYLLFTFSLLFFSCEEEIVDDPSSTSSEFFICKIDGEQLSDSSPSAQILTTNPVLNGALEITAASNLPNGKVMNQVTLTIYNFSSVSENTSIHLSLQGQGEVWKGVDIWQTSEPNFTGTLNFSKITANTVSGTFNFEGYNADNATNLIVTEGSFSNVLY